MLPAAIGAIKMKEIKNIVVVGAGMMGNALAQVFASDPSLNVVLKTRTLKDDRYEAIENNLNIMICRVPQTEEEKKAIIGVYIS
jgi:3-hydroxyacyl-CoA dehydrogenase